MTSTRQDRAIQIDAVPRENLRLTRERRLGSSSIIVAVSALRFFYAITLKRP
jgi:hypothetical protein